MLRFVCCCFFILFYSCSSNVKEQDDSAEKEAQPVPPKKEKVEPKVEEEFLDFLTTENCEDLLLDYGSKNKETTAILTTPLGDITIELYENTPVHRANFVYLTKRKFFDETVFYRVIDTFMIQGGNSDSWDTQRLKAKIGNYKLQPEMVPGNFHKRGALAAARSYTDNPDKLSSPFVFYIVQRGPIVPEGMTWMEREEGKTYTPEIRQHYIDFGGSPGLDGEHTVFGEVIEGMDIVDKIAEVEVDGKDWPKEEVWIKMKVD